MLILRLGDGLVQERIEITADDGSTNSPFYKLSQGKPTSAKSLLHCCEASPTNNLNFHVAYEGRRRMYAVASQQPRVPGILALCSFTFRYMAT